MRYLIYPLLCLFAFASCAEQYKIAGNSNVTALDGRMLYLKVAGKEDLHNFDSCEVIHGKFTFNGMIDSVFVASLYMDNQNVMPVVIENGDLTVMLTNVEQRVTGGPLNNKLYKFLREKERLLEEMMNLPRKQIQMMQRGEDPAAIKKRIQRETKKLSDELENLETNFITKNYNNVLGPAYFMYICEQYHYPIFTPQIKKILSKAPPQFLAHPFVNSYMAVAKANMQSLEQESYLDPHNHR